MANKKKRPTGVSPREMAAVMFTDVRGYSSLAQRDESLALQLLELKRKLAEPLFVQYHGRVVKTIGDAFKLEFRSALDAVRCATELQKRLQKHNRSAPEKERLLVRIGVHLGDVIRKGEDLLGDTVNIAARVEPQAEPGGVAFTQAVYDQIKGKFDLPLTSLGNFELKGIETPMPLYAVQFPWSAPTGSSLFARLKQHHMFRVASWYATAAYVLVLVANAVFPDIGLTREDVRYVIAVLVLGFPLALIFGWMFIPPSKEDPAHFSRWKRMRWRLGSVTAVGIIIFVAVSGAYLWKLNAQHLSQVPASDEPGVQVVAVLPLDKTGLVDEAIVGMIQQKLEDALSGIGNVRIVSHNGFPTFTGSDRLHQLAKATGATLVVQGTIQHGGAGAHYVIHMEIVSSKDDQPLYQATEEYASSASFQDMAQQLSTSIDGPVRFLTEGDNWIARGFPTTRNPRAFQLLRRAIVVFNYGGDDFINLAQEAVDLDPNFAQAHAYLGFFIFISGGSSTQQQALNEIERAETLAPDLPEAKFARAQLKFFSNDPEAALPLLESVETPLQENFWQVWIHGVVLYTLGRWDDSVTQIRKAMAIDPLNFRPPIRLFNIAYARRDYEEAASELADYGKRYPLQGLTRIYKAQVEFARDGEVDKLAQIVDGDWSAYLSPSPLLLLPRRIEVAQLRGQHAEVIRLMKDWPHESLWGSQLGTIVHRQLWVDTLTAESLRLQERDTEARSYVSLNLPRIQQETSESSLQQTVRIAMLEAFAGDDVSAKRSLAPLLTRLAKPPAQWSHDEAALSDDVAVVLAWSGDRAAAIKVLSDSLTAVFGAHASIVAHDPVWRPLYKEPAFIALLAAHGQKLAYAK